MAGRQDGKPRSPLQPHIPDMAAAVGAALMIPFARDVVDDWTGGMAIVLALILVAITVRGKPVTLSPAWLSAPAAVAYVGFLGAHLVPLRELDDDGTWVFLAILGTWATDTFAYAIGRLIGRTKIAPRISPGKTLEGTAAGLLGGWASIIVIAEVLGLPMSLGEAAILGAVLPGAAVFGDLVESHIKRSTGVKDTSELVPGHGGVLDRLDSLLFTVPLVYYFAIWVVF